MLRTPGAVRAIMGFKPGRVYFGWWIVAAAFGLASMTSGFYTFGFGVIFKEVQAEFGVGRAVLSLPLGLSMLEGALLGPIQGAVVDRFGARRLMFFGITVFGLGFILVSTASSFTLFLIYYTVFMGIGSSLGTASPAMSTAGKWFVKHRGKAIGVIMAGIGAGTFLVSVVRVLDGLYGWRGATFAIGIMVWAIGYPLVSLMRSSPEAYGRLPDGEQPRPEGYSEGSASGVEQPAHAADAEPDFTTKEALSTRAFWLISLSGTFRNVVAAGAQVHFIPAMTDGGISETTAASLVALFGAVVIAVRLLSGFILDRFDKRILGALAPGSMIIPLLLFPLVDTVWMAAIYQVLLAVGWAASGVTPHTIRGDYFGRRRFATIAGFGSAVGLIGVVSGPFVAGRIFDVRGNYDLAFQLFAAVAFLAMVLMWLAKPPSQKRLYRIAERA